MHFQGNVFQDLKEKKILDKDGKVDALGPYGKSKLTGMEVNAYFKKNKVTDPKVKKAVEVALDLAGASTIASKEIAKFYGNKILKSKEVQKALKYANESFVDFEVSELSEELLNEKNLMPALQKIVSDKSAAKVGGVMIDMFTASVIVKAYDAVNDSNKAKMEKANINILVKLAHKVMGMKEELEEQGMGDKIGKLFRTKNKKEIDGIANLMNMTSLKVLQSMQKQNPKGFKRMTAKMGELPAMEEVEEGAVSAAQRAAIAISKKEKAGKPGYDKEGKSLKNKKEETSVMDAYRQMWEDALVEEVADITVDPKNKINSGQQQGYHGMEIAKQARRMGLKSAVMHKHVRIKGSKKAVNDFLRLVIGKSRYGDPTEKDMSTPQVDKMLTKGLK